MKTGLHGDPSGCRAWLLGAGALSLVVSACASHRSDARVATIPPTTQVSTKVVPSGLSASEDREATVQISKALQERCKIQDLPQAAPRFEYDRAALHPYGRNVLDDVANCLLDGPLSGETITLVGRADARGSERYNESLAASRAAAARDYLALRGVPVERIRLMSRGERGAHGGDEVGYALDRRVDVEFGDLKNSPILAGTMLQTETARSRAPVPGVAPSYADTAEGGKPVGDAGRGVSPDASERSSLRNSAAGSVEASAGSEE